MNREVRIGYAMCGSYCTFDKSVCALKKLSEVYPNITPIMSENAYSKDTRFGKAANFIEQVEDICGKSIIHTIEGAEPFGPRALLDLLIISPCTGNTISKLAWGITDTCVTMAAKAHMRNGRPLLLAVSTNDALSGSASGLGTLMNRKNIYFVPFYQDDPHGKPCSLAPRFDMLIESADAALGGRQIQPMVTSI